MNMDENGLKMKRLIEAKVGCMKVVHRIRGHLWLLVEQPSGSWAFRQPEILELMGHLGLFCVCTWMGLFSHDLAKCSHLMTNVRHIWSGFCG